MKTKHILALFVFIITPLVSFGQTMKDAIDFYQLGNYEEARAILERFMDAANVNQAEVDYYHGMILVKENKFEEAKRYFEKGIETDSNYPYNYAGKGLVALKMHSTLAEDSALFRKARLLSLKDASLETAIAEAYYLIDSKRHSRDIYRCLNNARKWRSCCPDIDIFEGDMAAESDNWGDALGKYEMAFNHDPDNVVATIKYARIYIKINPQYALSTLEIFFKTHPNSLAIQTELTPQNIASLYFRMDDYEKASENYKKIIDSQKGDKKTEFCYALSLYLSRDFQKSYEASINVKNRISSSDNLYFPLCRLTFYNLCNLKKWGDATIIGDELFSLENTVNSDQYVFKDYEMYAIALDNLGKAEDADSFYKQAIDKADNKSNNDKIDISNLMDWLLSKEKYDLAIQCGNLIVNNKFAKVTDYNSLNALYYHLYTNKKYSLIAGKYDIVNNGINLAEKALTLSNNDLDALFYKAFYLCSNDKQYKDENAFSAMTGFVYTANTLNKVEEYKNQMAYAYQYLTNYYITQKDKEYALMYALKWQELTPNSSAVNKLVKVLSK